MKIQVEFEVFLALKVGAVVNGSRQEGVRRGDRAMIEKRRCGLKGAYLRVVFVGRVHT